MNKYQNEGPADRAIRVILGLILLLIAYNSAGITSIVLYIIAAVLIITAATGFCALYKIFNFSTAKK
jgi:uncharacterized membrane protein